MNFLDINSIFNSHGLKVESSSVISLGSESPGGGVVAEKTHEFDNNILLPDFSANCEQFFTQACSKDGSSNSDSFLLLGGNQKFRMKIQEQFC